MNELIGKFTEKVVNFSIYQKSQNTEFDRLQDQIIADLIERYKNSSDDETALQFEKDLCDFERALYKRNTYEYGKRLENIIRRMVQGLISNCKIPKEAKNNIGDILITDKNGHTVVVEMKSFVDNGNSPQGMETLRKNKERVEAAYQNYKYLVFTGAGCFYESNLKIFKEHDWIILQAYKKNSTGYEDIWEAVGFANYRPFHRLIEHITKTLNA